jgi:hypothetical protein
LAQGGLIAARHREGDYQLLGGDNDPKKNADGSITMYLQHDNEVAAGARQTLLSLDSQLFAGTQAR